MVFLDFGKIYVMIEVDKFMPNRNNLDKFTIEENHHYSKGCHIKLHSGLTRLSNEVIFTDSCLYQFDDVDQLDTNKLFGLSYGLHHNNSIRFGWRADNNKIKLSLYCYNDSKRSMIDICNVDINNIIKLNFEYDSKKLQIVAIVEVKDATYMVTHPFKMPKFKLGYHLWPYFGGNKTAPHEIHIWLKH